MNGWQPVHESSQRTESFRIFDSDLLEGEETWAGEEIWDAETKEADHQHEWSKWGEDVCKSSARIVISISRVSLKAQRLATKIRSISFNETKKKKSWWCSFPHSSLSISSSSSPHPDSTTTISDVLHVPFSSSVQNFCSFLLLVVVSPPFLPVIFLVVPCTAC